MSTTKDLHNLGQSLWLDNITREILDDGTLRGYIEMLSVTGLTSNPTIFDEAIGNTDAYDDGIRDKAKAGKSGEVLFMELALEDLRRAADLFRPVFDATDGVDGVSGSLTATAIMILGGLLYTVIGNQVVAGDLNIPFNPEGASWAIMAFVMVGAVSGYLWYNASPSQVLMGDAGSRPLGLMIGLGLTLGLVAIAGNGIQNTLFGVSTRDPLIYGAVMTLVAAVSLVATFVPARRATRVDPMIALRAE